MLHFSGVVSSLLTWTTLHLCLPLSLLLNKANIWSGSYLVLYFPPVVMMEVMMEFYWVTFCALATFKLLSGPRKSFELILLVNQPWAVIPPGAAIFPDFWGCSSAAEGKNGCQYHLLALFISPSILPDFFPLENCPCNSYPAISDRDKQKRKKKNLWSYRIFCVLMQSMFFTLTSN